MLRSLEICFLLLNGSATMKNKRINKYILFERECLSHEQVLYFNKSSIKSMEVLSTDLDQYNHGKWNNLQHSRWLSKTNLAWNSNVPIILSKKKAGPWRGSESLCINTSYHAWRRAYNHKGTQFWSAWQILANRKQTQNVNNKQLHPINMVLFVLYMVGRCTTDYLFEHFQIFKSLEILYICSKKETEMNLILYFKKSPHVNVTFTIINLHQMHDTDVMN